MEKINEIIYVSSVRCNLNCMHCGENQDIGRNGEMNGGYMIQQIGQSVLVEKDVVVSVTGGEPFLNESLPEFILEGMERTDYRFVITSNGYFYKQIQELVEDIPRKDRCRIFFHISIDGLETTHDRIRRNKGSFANAVRTVEALAKEGIGVSINTVVQPDNISELADIQRYFNRISGSIMVNYIPLALDISEEGVAREIYEDMFQQEIWPYLGNALDRKKVLSKGTYGTRNCHAGMKNIVVGPDGDIYICVAGAYYKGKDRRKGFCIGSLKENTLDEILSDSAKRDKVQREASMQCEGCSNPCEVEREVRMFGQGFGISTKEIPMAFRLEHNRKMGIALVDYDGWHEIERNADGSCLCWSNAVRAKIFVPAAAHRKIMVTYRKLSAESVVKILLDGKESFKEQEMAMHRAVMLEMPELPGKEYVTLTFLIDKVQTPEELYGSADHRYLGVGLESVVWKESQDHEP